MKCPVDHETLTMTERSGVEIDYCPKCRGVWLDRGELDKIIERSAHSGVGTTNDQTQPYRGDDGQSKKPYRKKRESFLSDLFDF